MLVLEFQYSSSDLFSFFFLFLFSFSLVFVPDSLQNRKKKLLVFYIKYDFYSFDCCF